MFMRTLASLFVIASLTVLNPAAALSDESIVAFGDSIVAGYNSEGGGLHIPGGNLVQRFQQRLQATTTETVTAQNLAFPGLTSSQIVKALSLGKKDAADATYLILDAGGNDYLHLKKEDKVCDADAWQDALSGFKTNWDKLVDRAREINPKTELRTLGLYFPLADQFRGVVCNAATGLTAYDLFLPVLIETNYEICSTSLLHGGRCVDLFAEFNCSAVNRELCQWRDVDTLASYRARIMLLNSQIEDPSKGDWVQKDGIHPNSKGHARIADLF